MYLLITCTLAVLHHVRPVAEHQLELLIRTLITLCVYWYIYDDVIAKIVKVVICPHRPSSSNSIAQTAFLVFFGALESCYSEVKLHCTNVIIDASIMASPQSV